MECVRAQVGGTSGGERCVGESVGDVEVRNEDRERDVAVAVVSLAVMSVLFITVLFLLKVEDARSAIVGGGEHARVIRGSKSNMALVWPCCSRTH